MSEIDESETIVVPNEPATGPAAKAKSSAVGIAWLALLVAVIALVAVGYTIYEDWRTQQDLELSSGNIEASIANLAGRIDSANQALAETEAQMGVLAQVDSDAADKFSALERDLNDRLRLLDALPVRTGNLEIAIAALQGVSAGARDTWLLGETEYYMQMANAQLQLAGNPELAALALGMADERIAQLANPALTNIRIAIADELAALGSMTTPDVEGITLKLASLTRLVASLPLRRIENIEDAAAEETPEDMGRLDRAWSSIKEAASGLVKHRTVDEQVIPLISPEAEYFLRINLTLQLQTARLALLRGEQSVFAESLADAAAWLETYFDVSSEPVSAALQTISENRDGMFAVATPDISGSLRLLRQYTTVSETAQ